MVIHLALGVSNQPDIAQHWAIDDALRFESLNEFAILIAAQVVRQSQFSEIAGAIR